MRMMLRLKLWPFIAKLAGQPGSKPGKGARHEIVIEVKGETADGETLTKRATVLDPQGQSHLTAIGALVGLEAITGLGRAKLRPGIAIPETAPDATRLIALLAVEGVDLRFE